MENMYVQFVKKQSMRGVVTMKTLQTLQISFAIIVFEINTIKDIELKRSIAFTIFRRVLDQQATCETLNYSHEI